MAANVESDTIRRDRLPDEADSTFQKLALPEKNRRA